MSDLETIERFVNTVHHEQGEIDEHLLSPADLDTFLQSEGLGSRFHARPADLRRALEVREAIRDLIGANNGEELNPEAVALLNNVAARSRIVASFDDHASWRVEPASDGVDQALGRLLSIVFRSMSEDTWSRMKACGNPDCRWAFYDTSKNHSGRWCEMASCGNRMKARAFRERARARSAEGAPEVAAE